MFKKNGTFMAYQVSGESQKYKFAKGGNKL